MSADVTIRTVADALGLPDGAWVDVRVPKKMLVEQGAPTSADKRAIQDGIDELQWFAACKPATIGVPAFSDETREYLEIAIVGCAFRPSAKAKRLIELIHRAIPYPVVLVTSDESGLAVSVAHKRRAQNEADRTVIDRVVAATGLHPTEEETAESLFLRSLQLSNQPRTDLYALYAGWVARIEALNSARLTGLFPEAFDLPTVEARRVALEQFEQLAKQVQQLRSQAARVRMFNQRVELNQRIQGLDKELSRQRAILLGEPK
ncbi:DUF4391 family protein [Devosia sp. D6-9]|nr:DUF4391 family protein [Devosia sp. D6-9]